MLCIGHLLYSWYYDLIKNHGIWCNSCVWKHIILSPLFHLRLIVHPISYAKFLHKFVQMHARINISAFIRTILLETNFWISNLLLKVASHWAYDRRPTNESDSTANATFGRPVRRLGECRWNIGDLHLGKNPYFIFFYILALGNGRKLCVRRP